MSVHHPSPRPVASTPHLALSHFALPGPPKRHSGTPRPKRPWRVVGATLLTVSASLVGCGSGSDADALGIAAMCTRDSDCAEVQLDGMPVQLTCITDFKDGYCSIKGCTNDADCPTAASCVAHDDGNTYCFRECSDKPECNENRTPDSEANCSSNFDYADPADSSEGKKACSPPSK